MEVPVKAIAASAVVLKEAQGELQLLLMKRAEQDGNFWAHVTGGIEAGETAWQTALREINEEAGISIEALYSGEFIEQFYDARNNRIMLVPVFVAYAKPGAEVVLSEEHSDYRWCNLAEAKALAPFIGLHKVYEHVWQHFVLAQPHEILKIPFAHAS